MSVPESSYPQSTPITQQPPVYWYDDFEWESVEDSTSEGSNNEWEPGEPPGDWDYLDNTTSRPVTPEDVGNEVLSLDVHNPLLDISATDKLSLAKKCRVSQPGPTASSFAPASTSSSNIPPIKKATSKTTCTKKHLKGGKDWPPKMLTE